MATLPYAHYVYSRADLSHLLNSIPPFLIGLVVIVMGLKPIVKWASLLFICFISLFQTLPTFARYQCMGSGAQRCVEIDVGHDKIVVRPRVKEDLDFVKSLVEEYAQKGENILVVPFWPGVYPALNIRNPVWELYALTPQSEIFELAEIERIKSAKVAFVLIMDIKLDDDSSLLYENTHPLIFDYIKNNFERVNDDKKYKYKEYQLYRSKQLLGS